MIDWGRLQDLEDEFGKEDFNEIVESFLAEVEDALATLQQKSGAPALAEGLHFVKGCALNLGFRALSEACAAAEQLAASGEAQAVSIDKIVSIFAESRRLLSARGGANAA